MQNFSKIIISWYQKNKRELPWRNTKNPYYIWLSEIILQQTRVEQGLPYYIKFVQKYPTVKYLAKATEDEVLRLWQGLGYYSRARNLHYTAQQIVLHYHSKFPTSYHELIQLKGVGTYTAAAIASFSVNEKKAVVDGNVYRVLSRYFGIEEDISNTQTQKKFQQLANELLNKTDAGKHNQALMEFGALQCVPKKPCCEVCPLNLTCFANLHQKVTLLPIKTKKTKISKRYFNYFVLITNNNKTYIQKREKNDIWAGLYEFPLLESKRLLSKKELLDSDFLRKLTEGKSVDIQSIGQYRKHQLTHQSIFYRFIEVKFPSGTNVKNLLNVLWEDLDKYPKPIIMQRFFLKCINL
ncbi:MAG: A/G-specific adenine glycosylase [Bacteroidia bacterium]|nr:A/G-specific adenine glycosylase [Bacteroidia bacterium]MCZ2247407.1 A/G-specific adenine glycosylase [Bacteroidia bacterium]